MSRKEDDLTDLYMIPGVTEVSPRLGPPPYKGGLRGEKGFYEEYRPSKPYRRRIHISFKKKHAKIIVTVILIAIFVGFPIQAERANIPTNLSTVEVGTFVGNVFGYWIDVATTTVKTAAPSVNQTPAFMPLSSPNTTDIEIAIFKYVNIERINSGVKELVWDDELSEIAREHSEDMAKNSFFSHTNLRGEDPTARAIRHGYILRKELGGGYYRVGIAENIGKMTTGYVEEIGYVNNDADSIAKAQVKSWMSSVGHRRNILDPSYDRLGIGVAYDGAYYISTQNFW